HNRLDMINDLSDEGFGYWDKVREIAFIKKHPVGEVLHAENGQVLYLTDENGKPLKDSDGEYIALYHFLKPGEEKHLKAGSDGIRRMFYNGIFNTPDEAARNAVQLSGNEHEPLYFTYFPKAEDKIVELGVAFYQKFIEGNSWGLSNSTKKFQDFIYRYGNTKTRVSAHSRGSMTVGNGLRDFKRRGIHGIAEETDIYLYGPAYNAQKMANTIYIVSDGKKDHVYLQNHAFDPIGTGFGRNPPTSYNIPLNLDASLLKKAIKNPLYMTQFVANNLLTIVTSPLREQGKALAGFKPSTHNCYGNASDACVRSYGTLHSIPIYKSDTILDNSGLGYLWRKK
ncbi:filamentous hemagglutinin, partial [Bartonella sp. 220]|nr:filamentous hemagglutinin [Bartonella sp. 220B]